MLVGRIDREAWAREIATLITRFDPGSQGNGNKSAFALRIKMTRQTVQRWLDKKTDITQDSVRQVFENLDLTQREQAEILGRVGYFPDGTSVTEIPEPPAKLDLYNDPVIKRIMEDPNLDEDTRLELVEVQARLIKEDRDRRQAEYDRLMSFRQGRRDAS
jgi:hypothetical protein